MTIQETHSILGRLYMSGKITLGMFNTMMQRLEDPKQAAKVIKYVSRKVGKNETLGIQ